MYLSIKPRNFALLCHFGGALLCIRFALFAKCFAGLLSSFLRVLFSCFAFFVNCIARVFPLPQIYFALPVEKITTSATIYYKILNILFKAKNTILFEHPNRHTSNEHVLRREIRKRFRNKNQSTLAVAFQQAE